MVAITFLMSSLARLRVSARTVRPAMLAGLGPRPSPRLGRLPSGGLRLGARPGRRCLGLQSLRELAAPSLAPQRLRESPPRFLLPRPAPARPRSGRAARAARAQAWKPAGPAPPGPGPSGRPDAKRPLPAAKREGWGQLGARTRAAGLRRCVRTTWARGGGGGRRGSLSRPASAALGGRPRGLCADCVSSLPRLSLPPCPALPPAIHSAVSSLSAHYGPDAANMSRSPPTRRAKIRTTDHSKCRQRNRASRPLMFPGEWKWGETPWETDSFLEKPSLQHPAILLLGQ